MTNLRETNFVLSRKFVTRYLLLVLINNNLCDKKNRGVTYIKFFTGAFESETNVNSKLNSFLQWLYKSGNVSGSC